MSKFIIKVYLFLIVLMSPCAVHAVSLGNLTLNSYLGQPFKAEIDLVAVKKEEIPSLVASLASRDTFKQTNVDYVPFLFTFEVSIENRASGQPYIKITSPQRVVEPFLSMLIELNWSSGRLIREYTILLDPPEDALQPTAPAMQIDPVVPSSINPEPDPAEKPSITTYGPVKKGDTLAKIALEVAPPRVQLNQVLIAMHRVNRGAFSGNNMNRLKTGPILRVPDASEIATISPDVADKEVKVQTANWEAYRQKLAADVASSVPARKESTQAVAGRITTTIESGAKTTKESAKKESLKISKGKGLVKSSSDKAISDQEKIHSMQENAIARDKALIEANERVALLEKNIKDLNYLLELESKNALVPPMEPSEVGQIPSIEGESVESSAAETPTIKDEPSQKVAPPKPAAKPLIKHALVPAFVEEPPLMDEIMESVRPVIDSLIQNIEYVGLAILLLLTGIFGATIIRRKKEEQFAL